MINISIIFLVLKSCYLDPVWVHFIVKCVNVIVFSFFSKATSAHPSFLSAFLKRTIFNSSQMVISSLQALRASVYTMFISALF